MRSGKVEPYRRTYAKRLPKAPALLAELEVRYRDSLFDGEPLPMLAAPQRPKAPPRKREKIPPPCSADGLSADDHRHARRPWSDAPGRRRAYRAIEATCHEHNRRALRCQPTDRSARP